MERFLPETTARRTAEIEGQREAQLLAEADAEIQRRRIIRLQREIELRTRLVAARAKAVA
jgi:hypothetical protein